MTAAAVALSAALLAVALRFSRIERIAADAVAVARGALGVMRDPALDEDAKERLIQRGAVSLAGKAALLTAVSAAILAPPFLLLLFFHAADLAPLDDTLALAASWRMIALAAALGAAAWLIPWLIRR